MPTLILRDPWRVVEDLDTGLGNRLMAWHVAYHLITKLGNDWYLGVYLNEYPELVHLSFPKTKELKYKVTQDSSVKLVGDDLLNDILEGRTKRLPSSFIWETGYTWDTIQKIQFSTRDLKYIQGIEFKDLTLKQIIKDYAEERITLHIRRGNGVYKDESIISRLPEDYQKYYRLEKWSDKTYQFVGDANIQMIVNKEIKKSPLTKFFFCIDIDEKAIEYLELLRPGHIFTRKDFKRHNKVFLDFYNINQEIEGLKTVGDTIIDFFILAFSKYLYITHSSSWGRLAQEYSEAPFEYIEDNHPTEDYDPFYYLRGKSLI